MPGVMSHARRRSGYDVAIVGGGIYGAALLWETASRGLRAILLEQKDFACATSANSLKIIHGGIHYLQNFDIPRLRAAVAERRALLRIAPHLVAPLPCLMPTRRALSKGRLAMGLGFALYDLLARRRNEGLDPLRRIPSSRLLSRAEVLAQLPGLAGQPVTGGACWHDAQAWNTERLVLAFVMSAKGAGAQARNYCRVEGLMREGDAVRGVMVRDAFSGEAETIPAACVVDCRGPWQGEALAGAPAAEPAPAWARAYNLVLRRRICDMAVGLQVPAGEGAGNGRLLFATPWRDGSIIGTWYDQRQLQPGGLGLDGDDIALALAQINRALPGLELRPGDVCRVHVGLLPCEGLDRHSGEPLLKRRHCIRVGRAGTGLAGLIQVQGVKYTTARQVAEETVNQMAALLGRALPATRSHRTPLYGGEMTDLGAWQQDVLGRHGRRWSTRVLRRLMRNYGTTLEAILAYADHEPALAACVPGLDDTLCAELAYVLDHEMVWTLEDLLLRRTDIASFQRPPAAAVDYAATLLATRFAWDAPRRAREVRALLAAWPDEGRGQDHEHNDGE